MDSQPSQHIAIAEDDDDFRTLLATMLRWDGHTVIEFADGAHLSDYLIAGVETAKLPDLVVADIVLPTMTGLAACRRAQAAGCSTLFIFMSTFNDDSMLQEAMELGPDGMFRKPFDIEALRRAVTVLHRSL